MISVYRFCDSEPMDSMGKRLKWAREQSKFKRSASAAAKHFRWKVSTYLAHENGQNDFGAEIAEQYAQAYNVNAGWLLTGQGDPHREAGELHQSLRQISQTLDHLVNLIGRLVEDQNSHQDDPPPRPSSPSKLKRNV